ncbi:MAG: deoxyribodipyrimidine photo-lyase [Alphaproteobacteria bacterium GM202ARS2]|nr:deoxyribodipyrimidine photo-lyase [Alphaproteobacteria bacterium GM202ARS2]
MPPSHATEPCVIVWFRHDLRLADNPAFICAAQTQKRILPLYILDEDATGTRPSGAASRWWLHASLEQLNKRLDGALCYGKGQAMAVIDSLVESLNVSGVYWTDIYHPSVLARDATIKAHLHSKGIDARSFNGSLLRPPQTILKEDGTPYKVFTSFYRTAYQGVRSWQKPQDAPQGAFYRHTLVDLLALGLRDDRRWSVELDSLWVAGEDEGERLLRAFVARGLRGYEQGRDGLAGDDVSRLSSYLCLGALSPHRVVAAVMASDCGQTHKEAFFRQLVWREFAAYTLYHVPSMPHRSLQPAYERVSWRDDARALQRWQQGQTGYPLVDAGMRQLWQTGYMHGRARMVVGSFLVKNLLLDWRDGEAWFWDTLVDADLASNSFNWQWVAGCGRDAVPYFRIFNPVLQGRKFDADGRYVRCYVPELARLDSRYLHAPWEAPQEALAAAGVALGRTYPLPMVEWASSRKRALQAYKDAVKG